MVSRALFTACCLDRVRVLLYAIYTFLDLNNLLPLNNGVESLPFWSDTGFSIALLAGKIQKQILAPQDNQMNHEIHPYMRYVQGRA